MTVCQATLVQKILLVIHLRSHSFCFPRLSHKVRSAPAVRRTQGVLLVTRKLFVCLCDEYRKRLPHRLMRGLAMSC